MNPLPIVLAGAALMVSGFLSDVRSQTATPKATPPETAAAPAQVPLNDADFVKKATIGNRFEIAAGQLALANGADPKVQEFGRMMVDDHGMALKELDAASPNTPVPAEPALDPERQEKLDALKAKKGTEFDAAYKADMKKAHDDTLVLLKGYLENGRNEKLKAWATKTLPTVQKHRDAAYAL